MLSTFFRGCLVAGSIGLLVAPAVGPARAEVIVDSSDPFRLGASLPGSQSAPSIAPFGGNGSIAAWISPSGTTQFPYIGYYSIFGDPRGQSVKLQSATGPTAGANASSTAVVSFADASSLILFSAAPRTTAGQDIFAQRMSAFREKVGVPVRINQSVTNFQGRIFATRLTSGKVLATWLTHGSAASSYNLRGRVVTAGGGGALTEVAVTADTAGAQTQTGLAALTNGNAVIAYFVQTGSGATAKQSAYLQRLSPTGTRLGAPRLIKQTTGPNTYGGVAVAALSGGRYMAIWFGPASGGRANVKVQIFQANGTAGAISTIAVAAIKPTSDAAPKAVFSEDGVVVAFDAFNAGTYGIVVFLLNNSGQPIAAKVLTSGGQPLVTTWLAYASDSNGYYLTWTQKLPSSVRSFGDSFYVSEGCSVKC